MRTSLNAADVLSVLFLTALLPQCFARPSSALTGRWRKPLPLIERRDSAVDTGRRESLIVELDSVMSRRNSAVTPTEISTLDLPGRVK